MSFEFEFDAERRDGSGIFSYFKAGETILARQLVYQNSNGLLYLTDASNAATMPCLGMAIENAGAGQNLRVLLLGFIGYASWSWTVGDVLYVSETTPGAITSTQPSSPDIIQEIGQCTLEADLIFFNPKYSTGSTPSNEITVRKNSGANVGSQPRLNFIEGTNISMTISNDAVNSEIDITINQSGVDAHHVTHEPGGADEVNDIDISNTGTLLSAHKSRHQNGGADEIDVTGLSGDLADPQDPKTHASTHEPTGSDEVHDIDISNTGTLLSAHKSRHEPAGADEINDIDISNTGTLLSAHKSRHVSGGADAFAGGDLLNATARVGVSKNSGADVGARRSLNLIEGANVTITVTDDAGNEEVDITIAAVGGGGGGGGLIRFFPATEQNDYIGTFPSMLMADDILTLIRQCFMIPPNITSITTANLWVISEASGNIYWSVDTNFGVPCTEDFDNNTDSIAYQASALTSGRISCLSILNALTGATGGDVVGIEINRNATNVLDTIEDKVHFIGIYIEGE